jgi:DNA-directed RNA polymerase specialized sigma24 family protein
VVSLAGQHRDDMSVLARLVPLVSAEPARSGPEVQPLPALQPQHRLAENEIDELVRAYQAGATVKDLVHRYGVCQTTVLAHLDRHGIARRQPVGLSDEQTTEATRLYERGLSLAAVGQKLGFDSKTVRKYLADAGVTIRPSRGRR